MTTTTSQPVLETAFHARTAQLTDHFVEYQGFHLPGSFGDVTAEYRACREKSVVTDLSPLRKYEVLGPDAEMLLQRTVTRDIRRLAVGQITYTAMCDDTGGMIDDGTVMRLGQDNFRWVGGDDRSGEWLSRQAEQAGLRAWVRPSTELHNLAVQGPLSRDILRGVIWTPPVQPALDELRWFRFSVARIGDYNGIPVVVSRTGYTGELGYEIWCDRKDGLAVWDAVWEAGQPHRLTPLGFDALDMLRIEAGLIFAGCEFSDQINPFEAGIGFTVALDTKPVDFIGRDALAQAKANPQRVLVGLELEGGQAAVRGDVVSVNDQQAGEVTSAMYSPILGKSIAMCRIVASLAEPGTRALVSSSGETLPATVVSLPFYDPEKRRTRS